MLQVKLSTTRWLLLAVLLSAALPSWLHAASSNPYCAEVTEPSYMDIVIEPPAGQNSQVTVFLYNISHDDYIKNGIPGALIINVNQSDKADIKLCYQVTDVEGWANFTYNSDLDGCVDYWLIFCPHTDAITSRLARETCLNGTKLPNSLITGAMPPCGAPVPPLSANTSYYIPAHNQFYQCNKKPPSYAALCWPLMLILSLLIGASFLAGKNPFSSYDFSAPRLNRGRQYSMRNQNKSFDITTVAMVGLDKMVETATGVASGGKDAKKGVVTGFIKNTVKGAAALAFEGISGTKLSDATAKPKDITASSTGDGKNTGANPNDKSASGANQAGSNQQNQSNPAGSNQQNPGNVNMTNMATNNSAMQQAMMNQTAPDLEILLSKGGGLVSTFSGIIDKWAGVFGGGSSSGGDADSKYGKGTMAASIFSGEGRSDGKEGRMGGDHPNWGQAIGGAFNFGTGQLKSEVGDFVAIIENMFNFGSRAGRKGEDGEMKQGFGGDAKDFGEVIGRFLIGILELYRKAVEINQKIRQLKQIYKQTGQMVRKGMGNTWVGKRLGINKNIKKISNKEANKGIGFIDNLEYKMKAMTLFGRDFSVGEVLRMMNGDPSVASYGPLSLAMPTIQYLRDKMEYESAAPVDLALLSKEIEIENDSGVAETYKYSEGGTLFDKKGIEVTGEGKKKLLKKAGILDGNGKTVKTFDEVEGGSGHILIGQDGVATECSSTRAMLADKKRRNMELLGVRMANHIEGHDYGEGYGGSRGYKNAKLNYAITGEEDAAEGMKTLAKLEEFASQHKGLSKQEFMEEIKKTEGGLPPSEQKLSRAFSAMNAAYRDRDFSDVISDLKSVNNSDIGKALRYDGITGYRAGQFASILGNDVSAGKKKADKIISKLESGAKLDADEERIVKKAGGQGQAGKVLAELSKTKESDMDYHSLNRPSEGLGLFIASGTQRVQMLESSLQVMGGKGILNEGDRQSLARDKDAYLLNLKATEQAQTILADLDQNKSGGLMAFVLDLSQRTSSLPELKAKLEGFRELTPAEYAKLPLDGKKKYDKTKEEYGLGKLEYTMRNAMSGGSDADRNAFSAANKFFINYRQAKLGELRAANEWGFEKWKSGEDMGAVSAILNSNISNEPSVKDGRDLYSKMSAEMEKASGNAEKLNKDLDSMANERVVRDAFIRDLRNEEQVRVMREDRKKASALLAEALNNGEKSQEYDVRASHFEEKYGEVALHIKRGKAEVASGLMNNSLKNLVVGGKEIDLKKVNFDDPGKADEVQKVGDLLLAHKADRVASRAILGSYEGTPLDEGVLRRNGTAVKGLAANAVTIFDSDEREKKAQIREQLRGYTVELESQEDRVFRSSDLGVQLIKNEMVKNWVMQNGVMGSAWLQHVSGELENEAKGGDRGSSRPIWSGDFWSGSGYEQLGLREFDIQPMLLDGIPAPQSAPQFELPPAPAPDIQMPRQKGESPVYIFPPLTQENPYGAQSISAYIKGAKPTNQWETKKELNASLQLEKVHQAIDVLQNSNIIDEDVAGKLRDAIKVDREKGQVYVDANSGLGQNTLKAFSLVTQLSAARDGPQGKGPGLTEKAVSSFAKKHGLGSETMSTEQKTETFVNEAHGLVDSMAAIKVKRHKGESGVYLSKSNKQFLHGFIESSLSGTDSQLRGEAAAPQGGEGGKKKKK